MTDMDRNDVWLILSALCFSVAIAICIIRCQRVNDRPLNKSDLRPLQEAMDELQRAQRSLLEKLEIKQ